LPFSVAMSSRLSDRDIREIRHVASTYQKEPLRKIDAVGRNRVRVETGSDKESFAISARKAGW